MAISALSVQQIVAVIRQQIAAPVGKDNGAAPKVAPFSAPTAKRRQGGASTDKQSKLGRLIGQRLAALKKTDPDRGRKAFRIFLESVLIGELGEELINDPGFYQMVDDVQAQMEADPAIAKIMQEAIGLLLSGAEPV